MGGLLLGIHVRALHCSAKGSEKKKTRISGRKTDFSYVRFNYPDKISSKSMCVQLSG
jgi:hypothetical protein